MWDGFKPFQITWGVSVNLLFVWEALFFLLFQFFEQESHAVAYAVLELIMYPWQILTLLQPQPLEHQTPCLSLALLYTFRCELCGVCVCVFMCVCMCVYKENIFRELSTVGFIIFQNNIWPGNPLVYRGVCPLHPTENEIFLTAGHIVRLTPLL